MGLWTQGVLLGFDTETTGVNTNSDRVVTTALVLREKGRADQISTWLINPGIPIPQGAIDVHGVTNQMVQESGQLPGEALEQIAEQITGVLTGGGAVVAFNACYDFSILEAELVRNGLPTLTQRLGRVPSPVIDPLVIDRVKDRYRRGRRNLAQMRQTYGLEVREDLHTAENDVVATLDLLNALLETFPELGDLTGKELHEWQAISHRQWAHDYNAWAAMHRPNAQPVCAEWPLEKAGK